MDLGRASIGVDGAEVWSYANFPVARHQGEESTAQSPPRGGVKWIALTPANKDGNRTEAEVQESVPLFQPSSSCRGHLGL